MKLFLLIIWCAIGASGIEVPGVGMIVDSSGGLRAVQGVPGNFLLGPATVPGVLSSACSLHLCLAKIDSKILSGTGDTDAPPGPAVLAIDGDRALVFFPDSRTFARWHDNTLEPLDWTVDGELLSIRATEIAVRREGQVWIVRPDGAVVDWIAETAGPVQLLADGALFATSDEVILRRQDASEVRFQLTGVSAIEALGPHYAAIHTADAVYALRTEPGGESLSLLPGNSP